LEDEIDEDWLHAMDAARFEAWELPSAEVLFMTLYTELVEAAQSWGARRAVFQLARCFVSRHWTILGRDLVPQALVDVEVM